MDELLVTWIAPVVDNLVQLAWLNELGRIQKIVNVKVSAMTGNKVLLDDVATILRAPSDIVIWSGHGTPGGLVLSDNSLIRTKWLASQLARGRRTKVVILAACSSQLRDKSLRSLTETICRSGINVIGFPAEAGDCAAGTFIVEYVRALSVDTSVAGAFDVALEAIADEPTAAGVFLTPGIRDTPFNQESRFDTLDARLARIEALVSTRVGELPESETSDTSREVDRTAGGIQPLTRGKPGHIHSLNESRS